MLFWINPRQPEKFCVTTGNRALMITCKDDELKLIQRPLDASYAANIKSKYKTGDIDKYPIIQGLLKLLNQ